MAQYTQLTFQEICQLARRYNLEVTNYSALAGGAANSSFLLGTTKEQYILTIADDKSISDVIKLASSLKFLAKHNFPTTRLLAAENGEVVTRFQDKAVLVKRFIAGETIFDISEAGLFTLGRTLAQLHSIPCPEFIPDELPYGQAFFSTAYGLGIDQVYEEWLASQQTEFLTRCPDDLPKSLIHGDVAWDNAIYLGGEFQALIDFEDICFYFSVYDLSSAISGTCVGADGKLNIRKATQIVAGYQQVRKLTSTEQNVLQLFTSYAAVALSYWRYMKYNVQNPTDEKKFLFREKVALAEHIQAIPQREFNKVLNQSRE